MERQNSYQAHPQSPTYQKTTKNGERGAQADSVHPEGGNHQSRHSEPALGLSRLSRAEEGGQAAQIDENDRNSQNNQNTSNNGYSENDRVQEQENGLRSTRAPESREQGVNPSLISTSNNIFNNITNKESHPQGDLDAHQEGEETSRRQPVYKNFTLILDKVPSCQATTSGMAQYVKFVFHPFEVSEVDLAEICPESLQPGPNNLGRHSQGPPEPLEIADGEFPEPVQSVTETVFFTTGAHTGCIARQQGLYCELIKLKFKARRVLAEKADLIIKKANFLFNCGQLRQFHTQRAKIQRLVQLERSGVEDPSFDERDGLKFNDKAIFCRFVPKSFGWDRKRLEVFLKEFGPMSYVSIQSIESYAKSNPPKRRVKEVKQEEEAGHEVEDVGGEVSESAKNKQETPLRGRGRAVETQNDSLESGRSGLQQAENLGEAPQITTPRAPREPPHPNYPRTNNGVFDLEQIPQNPQKLPPAHTDNQTHNHESPDALPVEDITEGGAQTHQTPPLHPYQEQERKMSPFIRKGFKFIISFKYYESVVAAARYLSHELFGFKIQNSFSSLLRPQFNNFYSGEVEPIDLLDFGSRENVYIVDFEQEGDMTVNFFAFFEPEVYRQGRTQFESSSFDGSVLTRRLGRRHDREDPIEEHRRRRSLRELSEDLFILPRTRMRREEERQRQWRPRRVSEEQMERAAREAEARNLRTMMRGQYFPEDLPEDVFLELHGAGPWQGRIRSQRVNVEQVGSNYPRFNDNLISAPISRKIEFMAYKIGKFRRHRKGNVRFVFVGSPERRLYWFEAKYHPRYYSDPREMGYGQRGHC